MAFSKNRILEGREMILDATRRARAWTYCRARPISCSSGSPDANAVKARMDERGIVIRGAYGKWTNWSRVSTGRIEDVRRYAAALPEVARG